jgi:hypothetical protein
MTSFSNGSNAPADSGVPHPYFLGINAQDLAADVVQTPYHYNFRCALFRATASFNESRVRID